MILPNMQKPCSQCPFKKDTLEGWLGEDRIKKILNQESFVCHKTINKDINYRRQCAGHMIIKKDSNTFYRLASFNNLLNLEGHELVFDNEEDCINHHKFREL